MTDKRTKWIIKFIKDLVTNFLVSLGVEIVTTIAGSSYAFLDILLHTEEHAVALTRTNQETKDYIFDMKYLGWQRTTVAIYDVLYYLIDENTAAYSLQYG